ncbi:MAG: outer membrane protein assembly factor BamB [Phycisphaerales bacterium]|nr:outer membrane protein assembly factor BamB [Phycisphaerales bacterium]
MPTLRATIVPVLLGLILLPARGEENWAQWRGPNFNGSSAAKDLPDKLSKEDALWSTPIPGHSNGTPIVFGDRIFITSYTPRLICYSLSRKDGKILWEKEISDVSYIKQGKNDSATPSPVTDGKKVIFLFGTGDLVAFDMDGAQLWRRNLQKDLGEWSYQWLYGASPLLYKGTLYVQVLHRNVPPGQWRDAKPGEKGNDSYLLAVNPETGADVWKVVRPTEAKVESQEAYSTPIPWERPAGTQLLITGGDCVTAHDPQTGKELWRAGEWNPQRLMDRRLVASPVTWDGMVFVCPPKRVLMLAFGEGGKPITDWKNDGLTSDAAVPLVYQDNLYVLDGDKARLTCVDPKTGKPKWDGTLEGRPPFRTSPTGADGKIYVMNEAGDLLVCSANEFKILSKVSLGGGGGSRGSIAAVDGMIIVRTGDKVWAFASKK